MSRPATRVVPNSIIVLEDLEADTYENWKACMMTYLEAQELWDVIDHDPNSNSYSEDADRNKDWKKRNAAALLAIQTSCGPNILAVIRHIRSAKPAWETLADMKEQEQKQRQEHEQKQRQEEEQGAHYEDLLPQGLQFSVDDVPLMSGEWTVEEYQSWSIQMRAYLLNRGLWDEIIEVTIEPNGAPQVFYYTWREKNFIALRAIQASFGPHYIPEPIRRVTSAKIAWDILATLNKQRGIPPNASPPEQSTPGTNKRKQQYYRRILAAINSGDWDTVKGLLAEDPTTLTAAINEQGEAPIHAAIMAKQWKITRNLIELMSEKELEVRALEGATPLHLAACTQQIGIMKCLIAKNQKLVQLASEAEPRYPVTLGCAAGQRETTRYCYTCTPIQLLYPECGNDGSLLFQISIYNEWFDIALDLLQKCPPLSFGLPGQMVSPLTILAEKASAFYSGCQLWFWSRWIYSRIRKILEMKSNHAYAMAIVAILCKEISTGDHFDERVKEVENLLFSAAENGTKEIIIEILEAYPDVIYASDSEGRKLIMTAIVFRQEKIFSLLLGSKYAKLAFHFDTDKDGNNMLHLAGLPPPPQQLAKISGAALQMQRELQWFKEVESVMTTKYAQVANSNGDTPRQLFSKNHKQLKDEGEQWMKGTASSSTVVGALIITIMFTAAFTVPGGNVQETGLPIFRQSKTFLIFIISDAISLFSSSTSVMMFLGILTSRYAEDDFLKSLPTKLILGLSSLFLSIVAMMIAFSATLIIMLHGRLSVIIPVVLLAGVPIFLFARLQFPLLVEIFMSTYFGYFRRNKIQEAFLSRRNRFVNSWRQLWLRVKNI
ncbi:hypothetical protein Tsubulata_011571 [Turnera subulata]|uniref:PGG domain-containing protein n=1 Tax=Turnera subulata TaxID=218843 RepID=A0A9Q0GGZ3_9ROSI|nr:hypothetical protein Tsubulata_011571 [Turnera subulata]